jgi:hypothetical protein
MQEVPLQGSALSPEKLRKCQGYKQNIDVSCIFFLWRCMFNWNRPPVI